MKLQHTITGDDIVIRIQGDIDSTKCHCLENFWNFYVVGPYRALEVDLAKTRSIDADGIAQLFGLLRATAEQETTLTVRCPPPELAEALETLEEPWAATLVTVLRSDA